MERPREDQEHPGNLVGIMELDPLFQFFSEAGWGDPDRSDPTRETGVLEFFGGEGLDAFGVNHLRDCGDEERYVVSSSAFNDLLGGRDHLLKRGHSPYHPP